jgi:hypothetical protein
VVRHGKIGWGSRIPAGQTFRRVRALTAEYGSEAAVARALGYRTGKLQCRRLRITVRNFWKILQLYRAAAGLDHEGPVSEPDPAR